MSITSAVCNSFKQELLGGIHDLDTDTIKVALIKVSPTGTYNADTTNYTDGCIIYNSSKSDRAIAILSFGGVKTSLNGDLTIQFPSADASNAIIRIA